MTSWAYNFARNKMMRAIFLKNVWFNNGCHFKIRSPYFLQLSIFFLQHYFFLWHSMCFFHSTIFCSTIPFLQYSIYSCNNLLSLDLCLKKQNATKKQCYKKEECYNKRIWEYSFKMVAIFKLLIFRKIINTFNSWQNLILKKFHLSFN